jgi:surfactin synthase thioesterase subunit
VAEAKTDDWFVSIAKRPAARMRIAAFPSPGGGCAAFAQQAKAMPAWLELETLNLPGRQARFDEPFRTDLGGLVAELVDSCAERREPYLFFGYCSGALLAYCVARGLGERGATMPRRLVVGAAKPPHSCDAPSLGDLGSDELWDVLVRHQAVPPDFAARPGAREFVEPVMRADFGLVASYRHVPAPPLPLPVTVLVGDRDEWVTQDDIRGWADYSSMEITVSRLPAGHWFMEEATTASVAVLVSEAAAASA